MTQPSADVEWKKMVSGQAFDVFDPYIHAKAEAASAQLKILNGDGTVAERDKAARTLFDCAENVKVIVQPGFACSYGGNIHIILDRPLRDDEVPPFVFFNYGCTVLDNGPVYISATAVFGPGVHIYTVDHPTDPAQQRAAARNKMIGSTFTKPVTIGGGCFIGGRSVILPGVSIGKGTTIGAGSVVTRDIPAYCTAAGNPCRVLRHLEPPPP